MEEFDGMHIIKKREEIAGSVEDSFEKEIKITEISEGINKEEIRTVVFFSKDGRRLDRNDVYRCSSCGNLLVREEKIELRNRIFCQSCIESIYGLDKDDYKLMLCISHGIVHSTILFGFPTIQRISGIEKGEVKRRIRRLLDSGYLFRNGIFSLRLTSKGEEAFYAFSQICKDGDCELLVKRIKALIGDERRF
jgi:DNA-directed RNA polymerase subunit RPC12/RpoP